MARHVRLVLLRTSTRIQVCRKAPKSNWRRPGRTTVPDDCAGHTTRTIVAHGRACSIKRRKRAVKLGDFTALTLPTEGGVIPSKGGRRNEPWAPRGPPTEACWVMQHTEGKILADPMGHEPQPNPTTKRPEAITQTRSIDKGGRPRRSNRSVGSGFRRNIMKPHGNCTRHAQWHHRPHMTGRATRAIDHIKGPGRRVCKTNVPWISLCEDGHDIRCQVHQRN